MYRPKSSTRMPSRTFVMAAAVYNARWRPPLPKREADVTSGRDRITLLAVLWRAARIDDERALVLARDVGVDAHHPRVDLSEEHPSAGVVHVLEPVALRLGRRLHARVTAVAHVCDERGHPVHVLLDAARDVAEGGRVVRPDEREQIREAFDLEAQVRARAFRPLFAQPPTAPSADVDTVERPGDGVEAGGVDEHVRLVLRIGGLHAGGRDALDRRLPEVDEAHVRLVVDLVVATLERHPASAEAVIGRDQLLSDDRILHALPDLPAHELGDGGVGLLVDQHVAEVTHPDAKAGLAIELREEGLALLGAHLEGLARVGVVNEAAERLAAARKNLRIGGLDAGLGGRVDRAVVRRRAPVRGALEHREVADRLGDLGDRLHRGRAGADHRDALAHEAHGLVRPPARVVRLSAEALDARDRGHGGRREGPDGGDQQPGSRSPTVLALDLPLAGGLVVDRGLDATTELDVAAQVELVRHAVAVAQRLRLGREVLAPFPLAQDLVRKGIAVGPRLGVEPGPGVAVPVPGP